MHKGLKEINESYRLQHLFGSYKDPKSRIRRLVQTGELVPLKRGLYARPDCADQPRWLAKISNRLYGPSYISFEYALRWWALIPEHAANITSATFGKNRSKRFDTAFGSFVYRDVPRAVYPFAVVLEASEQPRFLIASAEKALCDLLYTITGIRSFSDLEVLLFDDLRIEDERFQALDKKMLFELSKLYHTETLRVLSAYTRRMIPEGVYG